MKLIAIAVSALAMTIPAAFADEPVNKDEAKSIQVTLREWGCEGGEMQREKGAFTVCDIDDALCNEKEYDIELDDKFDAILIVRH